LIDAPALLPDDCHAFGVLQFKMRIPLQNSGCSRDTRQRISNLVRQPGGQLSQSEQPFSSFHTVEVLLELLVDLGQPPRRARQIIALFPAAFGQDTREYSGRAE
jgi:hypothetical protein